MTNKNLLKQFDHLKFHPKIKDDLDNLDGSELKYVLKVFQRIQESDGEIGSALGKRRDIQLQGYKRVKLRKHGIRIVFEKRDNNLIIADIIVVGRRDRLKVYEEALKRLLKEKNE